MEPEEGDTRCREIFSNSNESICSASTRLQRNQAEKQRRDRLNGYIAELANLVPMVKNSSKPVDKVSVLRLAAAHMRLNLSCLNPKTFKSKIPMLPSSITSSLDLIEKSIGGFIVVTTFAGTVLFCSKCIEDFIGYQSINVIGQSIYNFVNSKEIDFFEKKINSAISRSKKEKNATKVIRLHLQQRPLPRSTEVRYRKMVFKLSVHSNEANNQSSKSKSPQRSKKVKHKDFGASSVLLMFVEPMKVLPSINRTFLLTCQDIYFTIHGLQGEIMYADQRIATITGYMPHEVKGISAYQFIFDTDVPIALFAQKAMFTSNDGSGLITYRLRILDSTYIYLQSKGQIVYKENTTEMSHFICLNRWLSDEEGKRELIKFQERYAPQITDSKTTDGKNLNNSSPSSNVAERDSEDTLSYFTNSNGPYSVEQVSSFPYSGNVSHEYFAKSNRMENSSKSPSINSNQSMNVFAKDETHALSREYLENHKAQTSVSDSNISPEFGVFGEMQSTIYQSERTSFPPEPCLVDNQFSTAQTSASNFNQHYYTTDQSQMLDGSKSFNGINEECFSVRSGEFNQLTNEKFSQSAHVSKFNLRDTSLDFNCASFKTNPSSLYSVDEILPFPEASDNHCFMQSGRSTFGQPYSSIQKPVNGFCRGKDADSISGKMLNILEIDCNLSQKATTSKLNGEKHANSDQMSVNKISSFTQSYSSLNDPSHTFCSSKDELMNGDTINADKLMNLDAIKSVVKEESTVYSNGFYSKKTASSGFESNGMYDMNSSYAFTANYSSQKFSSYKSHDTNSHIYNGASYRNGTNFFTSYDAHKQCDAAFGTSNGASLYSGSSISNNFTNGGRYYDSSISVSNKEFVAETRGSRSAVHGLQKPIGSKNTSSSFVNDSSSNTLPINPAKRIKTGSISKSAEITSVHQLPPKRSDRSDSFSDIVLDDTLGQSTMTEAPTRRDSADFDGELFDELNRFFEECPLPLCAQTQETGESALSTDLRNRPQPRGSTVSSGLVVN